MEPPPISHEGPSLTPSLEETPQRDEAPAPSGVSDVVLDSGSPRAPQEYVLTMGSTAGSKRSWASRSWQQLHASGALVQSLMAGFRVDSIDFPIVRMGQSPIL